MFRLILIVGAAILAGVYLILYIGAALFHIFEVRNDLPAQNFTLGQGKDVFAERIDKKASSKNESKS